MSETKERDAVLAEFRIDRQAPVAPGVTRITAGHDGLAMADEIVRQRQRLDRAERILAALREPSVAVVDAATEAFADYDDMRRGVRAAVAAAEREADG